jgi:hypothetical protein
MEGGRREGEEGRDLRTSAPLHLRMVETWEGEEGGWRRWKGKGNGKSGEMRRRRGMESRGDGGEEGGWTK